MSPFAGYARAVFRRVERCLATQVKTDLLTVLPGGRTLSGPTLLRQIRETALELGRVGIGAESRALLSTSQSLSLILAVPALWSLGAVPLLAEGGLAADEMNEMVRRFAPDRVLSDREALPGTAGPAGLPEGAELFLCSTSSVPRRALPRGTVLVRMTSGSSGAPRGVALAASQILADTLNILSHFRIGPEVPTLAALSISHAFGFSTLLVPLLFHGNSMVLLEKPLPEQFREALHRDGPFFFPGVPYLFDLLCRAGLSKRSLGRLGLCVSAGAPLPEATATRFRERSGLPIRNFYGCSECGAIAADRSRRGTSRPGCVGTPLPGVRVFLAAVRGVGNPAGVPGAKIGRIGVLSDGVALGYVGTGARERLKGGRFLTEDLGLFDARGRLHLLGRLDRIINVGGRKVRPEEVERALAATKGVREVVALAIPDPSRGEAVGAAVAGRRGLRIEELLATCRRRLSAHKVPRRIQILAYLPRTGRGKVDLELLRKLLVAPEPLSPASTRGRRPDSRLPRTEGKPRPAGSSRAPRPARGPRPPRSDFPTRRTLQR